MGDKVQLKGSSSDVGRTDAAAIRSEKNLYADGSLIGNLTVQNTDFKNKGYINGSAGVDSVSGTDITAVGLKAVNITVELNQYLRAEQTVGSTSETAAELLWFGYTGSGAQNGSLHDTDVIAAAFQTGDGTTGKVTLDDGVWAGTLVSQTRNITVTSTYKDVIPGVGDSVTECETFSAKLTNDTVASYGIYAGSASIALMDDAQDGISGETEISCVTQDIVLTAKAKGGSVEISNTVVSAAGLNVQELNIGEMTAQYDIDAVVRNITYEASVANNPSAAAAFTGNSILAAGINSDTFTIEKSFRGNINVTVDNVTLNASVSSGSNSIKGVGIIASGAVKSDSVLGGAITVDMSDLATGSKFRGYMVGIEAQSITVNGRTETSIELNTNKEGAAFALGFSVTGDFQSTAVSSDITLHNGYANAVALSVKGEFKVTDVDGTKKTDLDLFDFNGNITVADRLSGGGIRYGIMSQKAMNLRISGTVDVGTDGVAVQTQMSLNSEYEIEQLVSTQISDRIEFADTAEVTGIIGLTYGTDNVVMYSGAKVKGTLKNNIGNMLNLEFFLTENRHTGGIYQSTASSSADDVTLYSVTALSVNINNMLSDTDYVLMEYGFDVSSYFTYGSSSRYINVTYQGQTVKVTVPTGKGVESGVKAVFGDDAEATVYLSADGKSIRIVSGTVKNSGEYSDAVLYAGNGNRTLYYSRELGLSYDEYVSYHANNIIYNQDEETLRLCWNVENLNDLFTDENGTLQDCYYEVEYRFYHMAADGVSKEYAGESITEKGILQDYKYLTLTGIEDGVGVEWRVRAVSADGCKTTAWSSENDYTGAAEEGWEQVKIDITADSVPVDVSRMEIFVNNGTGSDEQVLDNSLVRLSWSGAEAGTYGIDHYTVEYFYSAEALSSEDQDSYWKYQDAEKLSKKTAVRSNELWSKDTTSQELYISNVDQEKYIYWRVSAVDTAKNAVRSDYVYGDYFTNYPNDKTPPYFVSPGNAEVHAKNSTYKQTWISYVPDADTEARQEGLKALLIDPKFTFAYYLDYCNGTPVVDDDWEPMNEVLTQDDIVLNEDGTFKQFERIVPVSSTDTKVRTHAMMGVMYNYNPGSTFSVDFYWSGADDVQSGVRSYVLQYKASNSSTWNEVTVSSSAVDEATGLYTYHTDDLNDGSTYTFRVYAIDRNGNSMVVGSESDTWNNETGFTFGDKTTPEFSGTLWTVKEYEYHASNVSEETGTYSVTFKFSSAYAPNYSVEGTDYASSNAIEKYTINAYLDGSETPAETWEYKYTRDDKGMWGFHYTVTNSDGQEVIADTANPVEGTYEVLLDGFGSGKYTFSVTARDFAGNEKTVSTSASSPFGDFYAPRFKKATLTDEKGNDVSITASATDYKQDTEGKWTYSVVLTWCPADDSYQVSADDPVQDNAVTQYRVFYRAKGTSSWTLKNTLDHEKGIEQYTYTVTNLDEDAYEFLIVGVDGLGNQGWIADPVEEYDSESGKSIKNPLYLTASVVGIPSPEWPAGTTISVDTGKKTGSGETYSYTAALTFKEADGASYIKTYEVTFTPPSGTAQEYVYELQDTGEYYCALNGDTADADDENKTITVHIADCRRGTYSVSVLAEGAGGGRTKEAVKTSFGDVIAPRFKEKTLTDDKGNAVAITVKTGNYTSSEGSYTYDAVVTWSSASDLYQAESDGTVYDNGVGQYYVQYRVTNTEKPGEWITWDEVGAETNTTTITGLTENTYDYRVVAADKLGNKGDGTSYKEHTGEYSTEVSCTVTGIKAPEWPSTVVNVYERSGDMTAETYSYTAVLSFKDATGAGKNIIYDVVWSGPDGTDSLTYRYEWDPENSVYTCKDASNTSLTVDNDQVTLELGGLDKAGYYKVSSIKAQGSCGLWTETELKTSFGDKTAPRFRTSGLTITTQSYAGGETKESDDVTYSAVVSWAAADDRYQNSYETAPQDNGVDHYIVQWYDTDEKSWVTAVETETDQQTSATVSGLTKKNCSYRVVSVDKLGNTDVLNASVVEPDDSTAGYEGAGRYPTSVSGECQAFASPDWIDETVTVTTTPGDESLPKESYSYTANLTFTAMDENLEGLNIAESETVNRIYKVTLKNQYYDSSAGHNYIHISAYIYVWDGNTYVCGSDKADLGENNTITVHIADCCKYKGDYSVTIDGRNSCCQWTVNSISTDFGDSYAPTVVEGKGKLSVTEAEQGYFLEWTADGFTDEYTDETGVAYNNWVASYTVQYRIKDSADKWNTLVENLTDTSYQSKLKASPDDEKYEFRVYAVDKLGNIDPENSITAYCEDASVVKLQTVKAVQDGNSIEFTGLYAYSEKGVASYTVTVGNETRTIDAEDVTDGKYTWTEADAAGGAFSVYASNSYGSVSNTVTGVAAYTPNGEFDEKQFSSAVSSVYHYKNETTGEEGVSSVIVKDATNELIRRNVSFSWDGDFTCQTGTALLYALEVSDNDEFNVKSADSVHITSVTGTASPFTASEFAVGSSGQVYVFTGISGTNFSLNDYTGNASAALNGMTDVYWRVVAYDSDGKRVAGTSAVQRFTLDNMYYEEAKPEAAALGATSAVTDPDTGLKTLNVKYFRTEKGLYAPSYGYVSNDIVISGCSDATLARLKEMYGNRVVSSTETSIRITLSNSSYYGSISEGDLSLNVLPGDTYTFSVISVEGEGREVVSGTKTKEVKPDSVTTLGNLGDEATISRGDTRYSMLENWTDESFNVLTDAENTLVGSNLIMNETCYGVVSVNKGDKLYIKVELDEQGRTDGLYNLWTQDGNQSFNVTVYKAEKGTDQYVLTKMTQTEGAYQFTYSADTSYYACVELADNAASYGWADLYITEKVAIAEEDGRVSVSWISTPAAESYAVSINGRTTFGTTENKLTELGLDGEVQFKVNGADIGKTEVAATASKKWIAVADQIMDVFCARTSGVWNDGYQAKNMVTGKLAEIAGKNTVTDIFAGSEDASVLVLTDDANGDALFLDDIYSALPEGLADAEARFTKINAVIAGKGDDIVDLTTDRYTGEGMVILGGEGNDIIWGSKTDDVISGGSGNDTLAGDGGNDIFCFGEAFGTDTVEQTADGSVTLWFKSGDESKWNADTMTYTDGINTVTVSGVTSVTLKFGDDESEVYSRHAVLGAFN